MPVSPAILVEIKAPATVYHLLVLKLGGEESVLNDAGYSQYVYIAGIVLGPNPAVIVDRVDGVGFDAVERAGFYGSPDLVCAWVWLLRNFNPNFGNIRIFLEKGRYDWKVKSHEALKEVSVA
jgi:hypothetical protein